MAPEQVRGETNRLDGRTDIWAMGVVLYQMLAGRRPFQGATWEELSDEILHRDPKPLRMIDDKIPAELEGICLKCLSKTVADRYTTAADLAAALHSAGEHEAGRLPRKAAHKISARLNVGKLGCGMMVATFGLLFAVSIMWLGSRQKLKRNELAMAEAKGSLEQVNQSLAEQEKRRSEPPTAIAKSLPQVSFSPDGKRIATGSSDETVKLWDATDSVKQTERDAATSLSRLARVYQLAGDWAKAEPYYRQALEISKKALGENHPNYAARLATRRPCTKPKATTCGRAALPPSPGNQQKGLGGKPSRLCQQPQESGQPVRIQRRRCRGPNRFSFTPWR